MNTLTGFQAVIDHFKNNGWNFQLDHERKLLHAGFKGENGNFRFVVAVDESDDLVQAISFVPIVVPADKMAAAAELCARLSFPMKVGNFQLDCHDGELRFRTYSPYPKGELKDEVICRVVGVNLVMVDQYFPAFIKVIYGGAQPEDAASQVCHRPLITRPRQPEALPPSRLTLN